MSGSSIDLQFLAKQVQTLIDETRHLRKDVSAARFLTLQTYEYARRLERKQTDLRDDLETMVKMEFGGGIAHLQTTIETAMHRLETRMDDLIGRVETVERRG